MIRAVLAAVVQVGAQVLVDGAHAVGNVPGLQVGCPVCPFTCGKPSWQDTLAGRLGGRVDVTQLCIVAVHHIIPWIWHAGAAVVAAQDMIVSARLRVAECLTADLRPVLQVAPCSLYQRYFQAKPDVGL